MAKLTQLPLNKRFPGQHVIRCKLWRPNTSVTMEGPIPELVSDLLLALFTRHQKLTPLQRAFLRSVQEDLLKPGQHPSDGEKR